MKSTLIFPLVSLHGEMIVWAGRKWGRPAYYLISARVFKWSVAPQDLIVFGLSCSIYSKSKRNTKGKKLNLKKSRMTSCRWKKCWKILKKRYISPLWTFALALPLPPLQWQWKCPASSCSRNHHGMLGWVGIKSPLSGVILESRALPLDVSPWHI